MKKLSKISPSDLPATPDGKIYHLNTSRNQLADNIILVGDRDRAHQVAKFFHRIECEVNHREFRTITGVYNHMPITVIGTGIGTDNIEIVLTEIDALKRFNIKTRKPLKKVPRLTIIRVGTSGALQKKTPLGTIAITACAIGLDNSGLFYDIPVPNENAEDLERIVSQKIAAAIPMKRRFYGKIHPYAANADTSVVTALVNSALKLDVEYRFGFTASASGFFGCQGRDLGTIPLTIKDLDGVLSKIEFRTLKFQNFEMEGSFLLHYAKALGHRAGMVCAMIANRRENTFYPNYKKSIDNAIRVALNAFKIIP